MTTALERPLVAELRHGLNALRGNWFWFVLLGIALIVLGSVALGVNRFVIPTPPPGHWWTIPALFMNAGEAALLEEVVVIGFLITRLRQLGTSANASDQSERVSEEMDVLVWPWVRCFR